MGQILHGSAKTTHAVRADASIQNNYTILCDYNDLDCLTGTNCTTGAQRLLAALSHRGTHHGPHARPDHRRSSCRAGLRTA